MTLEKLIEELSDGQLKEAFDEITEWRTTSVLKKDGVVRNIHQKFNETIKGDYPIYAMENPFLFEMAKRYYSA